MRLEDAELGAQLLSGVGVHVQGHRFERALEEHAAHPVCLCDARQTLRSLVHLRSQERPRPPFWHVSHPSKRACLFQFFRTATYNSGGANGTRLSKKPPSTASVAPVTHLASSHTKKSTAAATSSGWPSRPSGCS